MFSQLPAIFLALWVFITAALTGKRLLRVMGFNSEDRFTAFAMGLPLGYGMIGMVIFLFGLAGLVSGPFYALLFGTCFLVCAGLELKEHSKQASSAGSLRFNVYALWLGVLILIALVQALAPSTAHDALCYHLNIPSLFVSEGRITYLPFMINSVFPLLGHMYYVTALAWRGSELANLMHLFMGFGMTACLLSLARRVVSERGAWLACILFLSTPGIFNQTVIAYSDIAMSLFVFGAVMTFMDWDKSGEPRWFYLCGALLGFAAGVKPLAGLTAAVLFMLFAIKSLQRNTGPAAVLKQLFIAGMALILIASPWYLRSLYFENKLIYFGPGGYAANHTFSLMSFLLSPWLATMYPAKYGGTWAQLGPAYLAFVPLAYFFTKKKSAEIGSLFQIAGGVLLLWLILPRQNLRFLFPMVPVLAILAVYAVEQLHDKGVNKLIRAAFFAILFLQAAMAFYHGRDVYAVALGSEQPNDYLMRHERTYKMAQYINRHLPEDALILNAEEVRMFYIRRRMIRESDFRHKTGYDSRFEDAGEMTGFLKDQGISHVLLTYPGARETIPRKSIAGLAAEPDVRESFLELIYEELDPQTKTAVYRLYRLI